MKKNMKYFKWVGSAILMLITAFIFYNIFEQNFSKCALEGKKNKLNSRKIKVGMSKDDIINIMGKPAKSLSESGSAILLYPTYDDSHPYIEIGIDSERKVSYFSGMYK
jgi:hypothetical protein